MRGWYTKWCMRKNPFLKSLTSAIYAPIPNPGKIAAAIAILQIPKIIQLIYSGM